AARRLAIVSDGRIFPLREIARTERERLVGTPIAAIEPIDGGLTNTLHKVMLAGGGAVVVKHFVEEHAFADELAALAKLAGVLPVPEVVRGDPETRALVYRWIDGITFDACRR